MGTSRRDGRNLLTVVRCDGPVSSCYQWVVWTGCLLVPETYLAGRAARIIEPPIELPIGPQAEPHLTPDRVEVSRTEQG